MNFRKLLTSEKWNTRVGARFTSEESAETARSAIREGTDLPESSVRVIKPGDRDIGRKLEPESGGIARTMVRAHVVLGAAGLAVGLILAALLIALGIEPFRSSPGFSLLGLGFVAIVLGLLAGGLVGFRPDHDPILFAARDSSREGEWFLVAHVDEPDERAAVQAVLDRFADDRMSTA